MHLWHAFDRSAAHPLPPELPTVRPAGHLPAMGRDPIGMLVRAHREVGDIVRLRMGPLYVVSLAAPEYVEHVLVKNAGNYLKETRGYRKLRILLGRGLVTADGETWRQQRRIANPAFRKRAIEGFAHDMGAAALALADDWARGTGTIDLAHDMMRLTLRIAGQTLFGQDLSAEGDRFGAALGVALAHFPSLATARVPWPERWPTPANRRFYKAIDDMNQVVDHLIADRRASGDPRPDLMGMLMAAKDAETGHAMSDQQLKDEVFTMLTAGHETTANALTWTLMLLSQHPQVARAVEAEVDAVIGNDAPGPDAVMGLGLLGRVLKESMRLYPPVWAIARLAAGEDVIGGFRIPPRTYVIQSPYVLHRHPGYWPNPEQFDPDRWRTDPEPGLRYRYFPFAGGQRKCIGDHFATLEALIVLAVLVRRFRLSLPPGARVALDPSVTLRPRGGMTMQVTPRPSLAQGR